MRDRSRLLLIVEVLVCFAPAGAMLLIGAFMLPFQVSFLLKDPLSWEGPLTVICSVIGGLAGSGALLYVLYRLFHDDRPIERPIPVLIGMALGIAPLIPWTGADGALRLVALLPLICSAHIIFLSRRLLFTHLRSSACELMRKGLRPALLAVIALALVAFATRGLWQLDLAEGREA